MKKKQDFRIGIHVVIGAVLVIAAVAVVYIRLLDQVVSGNIIATISELAEHDQSSIRNYIESVWEDLEYIQGKFAGYYCGTIEEIETELNIECANSEFSHLYLIGEDGRIYTDKFLTYDPKKEGQNGRIDLLPLFENGKNRVVARFDDKVMAAGLTRESILYGVRLKDFSVGGISMAALVGISDIGNIQGRLTIDSFVRNGVNRGHSAVVDMAGNYIVNEKQTVYLNEVDNFLRQVESSRRSDLSCDEITEKMAEGESFQFYYTNQLGKREIVYCMPFEEQDIDWYFLLLVDNAVFAEQNRTFLLMSMVMLVCIVMVVALVLLFVSSAQKKVIAANAEATAKATFLANMSHEIRTPLNGIIGLIYLMEKDVDDVRKNELVKKRLSKAKATADYLLSLINNILDVSKLQSGKLELNREVISPEIIADAIYSMQKNNIESNGVKFTIEKQITVPWIIGDDILLKRVLMNIVGNAAKFTPGGGQISLSVTQRQEDEQHVTTVFTCSDTGCGMSEAFMEHIWDSFSQERSKSENSMRGTGLGMTISKLLVDSMGGEIHVSSCLGRGSTFTVALPSEIARELPEYMQNMQDRAGEFALAKEVKVLVAEDNDLNAEILTEILKNEGFQVVRAANGRAAVECFEQSDIGEINVILMDMQMPVMDGCSAAALIRGLDRPDAGKVPIFACTANSFKEDRARAAESGMNDFLSKPIDVSELLRKLGGEQMFMTE